MIPVLQTRGSDKATISTRTRSREDAEQIAQNYRDTHNPDKVRAAAAEAELLARDAKKESRTVTIEKAVSMFLTAKRKEGVSDKRIERYLPLLGDVDSNARIQD